VSFSGVTGANRLDLEPVRARVLSIKRRTAVPVAVGFGVRDAASATAIAEFADAIVIGSALVEHLVNSAGPGVVRPDAVARSAQEFLAPIRRALDARSTPNAA